MLISFSGLDGAGKSTLIAWTRAHLEQRGMRVAVFHMNEQIGLYAYARMLRDAVMRDPVPSRARSAAQRAAKRVQDAIVWNTALRSVLYPLDLLIFLLYRVWFEAVRRQVLIMDRYFYDTLVDLSAGRSPRTARLLQRLTPTPALAVLLDISPEESFARKGEYSVPYLQRRYVAYHQVLPRVASRVVVRNDDLGATQRVLASALASCLGSASTAGPAARTGVALPTEAPAAAHPTVEVQ
jgi:thymidylate kinase